MSFIKEFDHLKIPLKDIKLATNNFGASNYIGRGGFGKVYGGELLLSQTLTMVAVKRLDSALGQGAPEFWKEIMMLSRYKHENLVSLLGFCDESNEKILVYEYLSNKSLDLYLSRSDLSWIQRLHICIGAARGLLYLHDPDGTQQRVLHRDVKSSNILLDQNWKAKISDFGLSKFGPANQQFTFLVSNAVGTMGYCDPLYMHTGFLTKESDVYSFGVVLFEVLCGRLCVQNYEDVRRFLGRLAQQCYEQNTLHTIIDSSLKDQILPKCLEIFSTIAYQCLQLDRTERPSMAEIVNQLEIVLQYQENMEGGQLMESSRLWFSSLHEGNSGSSTSSRSKAIIKVEKEIEREDFEILLEDLTIGETIGEGSYGTVYRALWNGSEVAVKLFGHQESYSDDVMLSFKQEVSVLSMLGHPNIVPFRGAVISPQHLGIITEFFPRGNLFEMLQRKTTSIAWRCHLHMAMDIAQGMNYLHQCNPPVVLRNLKPSNLLVDKNWVVKVRVLDLSRNKHLTYLKTTPGKGMLPWTAPEILHDEPANEKSDVYSYGVVLWQITTEKVPWDGLNEEQVVAAVGFNNKQLEIPEDVVPLWASLIKSCWCREPTLRPTFQEIILKIQDLQKDL